MTSRSASPARRASEYWPGPNGTNRLIALRYLGLGAPIVIPVDEQGRVRADEMRSQLAEDAGPAIVCLRVAALVDRLVENAQVLAAGISQIDGTEVLMTSSIPRFAWHSGMTPGPRPWPAS
jgi:hypothetical protein